MLPEWAATGLPAGALTVVALLWWRVALLEKRVGQLTTAVAKLTLVLARTANADAQKILSEMEVGL
jgi:hypothetical protein